MSLPSRCATRCPGHRQGNVLRRTSLLALPLLLSLAFNVLALDHILAPDSAAAQIHQRPSSHDDGTPSEAIHLQHCHLVPGNCSDQPLVPPWAQLGEAVEMLSFQGVTLPADIEPHLRLVGAYVPPPDRPPAPPTL